MAFLSTKSRPVADYIQAEPLRFDADGNDIRANFAEDVSLAAERGFVMSSKARRERLMEVIAEYFDALDRKAERPSETDPPRMVQT